MCEKKSNHIQVTDEWLYKYMPVVDEAIIRSLEMATEGTYSFSKSHKRNMRRVIFRERYGLFWQSTGILKRIAALFVGVIGAFSLVTFGVEAFRMIYYGTFVEEYEDHVVKTFEVYEDAPFVPCEPEYIPEGYELVESGKSVVDIYFSFKNGDGKWLLLSQTKALNTTTYAINSEYDYQEEMQIFDEIVKVDAYNSGQKYIFYEYGNCIFEVDADALTLEEIEKVFENWIK